MYKNKLIIIEGATGSGKSSVSTILREQMLSTTLLRLSGIKDKGKTGELKSYSYHTNILNMILESKDCDINWILERSYLSDKIYCNIGLKDYSFEEQSNILNSMLSELSEVYDVYLFLLVADREVYETRLCRDKASYERFSVEFSMQQQQEYINELSCLNNKVKKHIIDTTELNEKDVSIKIIEEVSK